MPNAPADRRIAVDCRCRRAHARRGPRKASAPTLAPIASTRTKRSPARLMANSRPWYPSLRRSRRHRAARRRRPRAGVSAVRAAARRAAAPVAQAAAGVDDRDLHVPRQRIVLEPVVGHDDVAPGVRREQAARRARPIDTDPHRKSGPRKEQGFVTHLVGDVIDGHGTWRGICRPIAAADESGVPAARSECLGERDRPAGSCRCHRR